jgi:phosphoribosylanthranilate isomerase
MVSRIKICCIGSKKEAELAITHGASAVGLVSEMPSGPGVIAEPLIRTIVASLPSGIASFLLTSYRSVSEIIKQHGRIGTTAIQICDRLSEGKHRDLRRALPEVSIVQVVHVTGETSVEEALQMAPEVDALLLDSGDPSSAVKELGGTGRQHDWQHSKRICETVSVPVYLAGGLQPGNVADAIGMVDPYGVDVCTGVRTNGRLDEMKLSAFIRAVRSTGH